MDIIIYGLFIIGAIVYFLVMPAVAYYKAADLAKKLQEMERQMELMRSQIRNLSAAGMDARSEESTHPEEVPFSPGVLSRLAQNMITDTEPAGAETSQEEFVLDEQPIISEPEEAKGMQWVVNNAPEPRAVPEPPARGRSLAEWEELLGGNLFNRIGAVALLIGLGFLLKYGFDHNHITPWMLVSAGFVCGALMIVGGERFRLSGAQIFAQGLTGGGISVLYLSSYASCNMYKLIPQMPAIWLMCAVTAVAFWMALRSNALVVAFLGLIGGFLTPVLLGGSGSSGSGAGLFTYLIVLNVGLLALTILKDSWVSLEPVSLAATYLIYAGWSSQSYSESQMLTVVWFVSAIWVLYHALDMYRSVKSLDTYSGLRMFIAVANSVAYYSVLYSVINPVHPNWTAPITLIIGIAYLASMAFAIKRHANAMVAIPRYAVTSIALLAVATGIQFRHHEFIASMLWAVEAAALVWCGVRYKVRYVWVVAVALMVVAIGRLLTFYQAFWLPPADKFVPIANIRFAAFAVIALSCCAAAWLLKKSEDEYSNTAASGLHFCWGALLGALVWPEVNDYYHRIIALDLKTNVEIVYNWTRLIITGIWAVLATLIVWIGAKRKIKAVVLAGLAVSVCSVAYVAKYGVESELIKYMHSLLYISAAAFALVLANLYIQQRLLRNVNEDYGWTNGLNVVFGLVIFGLGFEALSAELASYIRLQPPTVAGLNKDIAQNLLLGIIWSAYSALVIWRGFAGKAMVYIASGLSLLVLAIMTLAIGGLAFEPISSFHLLSNLRAAAFVVLLASMGWAYYLMTKYLSDYDWARKGISILQVALCLVGFELVSVEVWSDLVAGNNTSSLAQMGLSVGWVVYSLVLLGFGIVKRLQLVRLVAIALFELAIIKVFIFDLSSLEQLYRIFSFIGLGLFLLASSFLYQKYKSFIFGDCS